MKCARMVSRRACCIHDATNEDLGDHRSAMIRLRATSRRPADPRASRQPAQLFARHRRGSRHRSTAALINMPSSASGIRTCSRSKCWRSWFARPSAPIHRWSRQRPAVAHDPRQAADPRSHANTAGCDAEGRPEGVRLVCARERTSQRRRTARVTPRGCGFSCLLQSAIDVLLSTAGETLAASPRFRRR